MRNLIIVVALCLSALGAWSITAQAQSGNGRTPFDALFPEAGGSTRTVQSVPTVRQVKPASDDEFKFVLSGAFIVLASCTIILFILGCGSRVVVFADPSDALMTACIFIAPIVTFLAFLAIGMMTGTEHGPRYGSLWAFAKDNPAIAFVVGVGFLWWAWAVIGTVVSSIRHNGLIIGPLVALMKFGAVFTILLAWFASEHAREPGYQGFGPRLFFLGILAWFASRYVNGHRVMERREMLSFSRNPGIA